MKSAGERGEQQGSTPAGVDLGVPGCEHAVEIGRGGFGAVYRAWQPEFGRTVAVKVLGQAGLEAETRRRLGRELRAMGALSGHPHIVTVHSAGFTDAGNPYLVMGFEPGGTLADRLRASGPVPWQEAVLAGIRISGALETAHRAGLLHRDVKPENVLLSAFGEPKLADFGVAQLQGAVATRGEAVVASIPHAAPELLAGGRPSVVSDVYALASTVHTLIRGRPAFAGDGDPGPDSLAMIARIGSRPVPDLRAQGVPGPVCSVLERAMAKSPGERPPSALDLGMELRGAARAGGATLPEPLVLGIETGDTVELVGTPPQRAGRGATAVVTGGTRELPGPGRRPRRRTLVLGASAGGVAVLAAAALAGTAALRGHPTAAWTARAPMPTARSWLGVTAASDGRIYAIGGLNGRPLDTVEAYDPHTDRWSTVPPLATARWGVATATTPDGRIFAIGGMSDRPLDSVEVYTPGGAWAPAAHLATPRWGAAAVTGRDGRIYVLGGFAGRDDRHALAGVEVYSPDTGTWSVVAPMHRARGALAAVGAPDGRIYALGGADGPDYADVEVYSPPDDTWVTATPLPSPRSGLAAGIGPDGSVEVIGGYTTHAVASVEVYSPGTRRWTEGVPLPVPLYTAVASTPDGHVYAIGGGTDTGGVQSVYMLTGG
ncbi:MAG TPA: kelch repeat-containing protein [Candidatus Dormibacteraeota bacterium]